MHLMKRAEEKPHPSLDRRRDREITPSFDPRFEAHLCVTVKRRRQPGMRRLGHGMMGYSAVSESRLRKRSKGG